MRIRFVVTSGPLTTYSASVLSLSASYGGRDILRSADFDGGELDAEGRSRCLNPAHLRYHGLISSRAHDR